MNKRLVNCGGRYYYRPVAFFLMLSIKRKKDAVDAIGGTSLASSAFIHSKAFGDSLMILQGSAMGFAPTVDGWNFCTEIFFFKFIFKKYFLKKYFGESLAILRCFVQTTARFRRFVLETPGDVTVT